MSILDVDIGCRYWISILKINKYVIVKFSATWCNPCQRIKEPFINFYKDSLKYNKEIKLILVDIDENREIPNLVRIKSVPTMIFYCSGDMENSCNSSAIENVNRFFETSLQNIKKNEKTPNLKNEYIDAT